MAIRLSGAGHLGSGLLLSRAALLAALAVGCTDGGGGGPDWCAEGPSIDRVSAAAIVLPGSAFAVSGSGFDESCGQVGLFFRGTFEGRSVDIEIFPEILSSTSLRYRVGTDLISRLGADQGSFAGELGVRRRDAGGPVREDSVPTAFQLAPTLALRVTSASPEAVTLQASVVLIGDGFLEGDEGSTEVILDGTFRPEAGGSRAVAGVRLPAVLAEEHDRSRTAFLFAPTIAGVQPGTFDGSLTVENRLAGGATASADPLAVRFTLGRSFITGITPDDPSLGAIVTIEGAGFIGGAGDQTLTVRLDGTATPHGGSGTTVSGLELVPRFVDGGHAEYTIVPVESAGTLVAADWGFSWGSFSGTATPILRYGSERVEGLPTSLDISIGPTRQVVFVSFLAGFSDTMRQFGLRAVEAHVKALVLDKFRRTFDGINVEARDAWPTDYYVGGYAVVEIGGPDPNGRGLFGYDNTPGKDVGNLRMHDRIGGANAEVQEDGYPGYGGIFVQSFLCWSAHHPAEMVCPDGISDPEFDAIFDGVRNREVVAGEYPGGSDPVRTEEIDAAVRALANLIGDTAAHEFGHSLGLAHPYGPPDLVHNEPPADGCLMDAGAYRPFAERAELAGTRPGTFCGDERGYLESILPVP